MDKKILWFDTETSGLDPYKHAIIQFAGLVDLNGKIIDSIDIKIRPFPNDLLNQQAMEIVGVTQKELRNYTPPEESFIELETFLSKHIDRYNKYDKFVLGGKNIKNFDIPFLRRFFKKCDNNYYGSWFENMCLDIDTIIAESMIFNDLQLPNYQLSTLCELFKIDINAHNALSDIKATRILYYNLKGIDIKSA